MCKFESFIVIGFLLSSIVFATFEDEQLMTAIAFLEEQQVNIESLNLKYVLTEDNIELKLTDLTSGNKHQSIRFQDYTFFKGKKRLDEYAISMNDPNIRSIIRSTAFNGKEYYTYSPEHKAGSIQRRKAGEFFPMVYDDYVYFKTGIKGLLELIRDKENLIKVSSKTTNSSQFLVLLLEEPDKKRTTEITLNKAANYQPQKILVHSVKPEHWHDKTPIRETTYEINVIDYMQKGNYYFPSKVLARYDCLLDTGQTVRAVDRKLVLEEANPHVEVDEGIFDINFPSGTMLTHFDFGIAHRVGIPTGADPENLFEQQNITKNETMIHATSETEMPETLPSVVDSINRVESNKKALRREGINRTFYGLKPWALAIIVLITVVSVSFLILLKRS